MPFPARYSPDGNGATSVSYEGAGGLGSRGASGEGVLYEFYTPDYVVNLMWELARYHGFDGKGTVLEPSVATGKAP
jgi:hypothetical protein